MWETGKARVDPDRATTCSFDGKDCYQSKVVPVIYNVSYHEGWSSGGQNITVFGHGFSSGEVKAYLDDVECVLTSKTDTEFSCEVQSSPREFNGPSDRPGGPGVQRTKKKNGEETNTLHTNLEGFFYDDDYYQNYFNGWFVAPETTRYMFY
jgi:hypothetical protein